MKAIAAVIVFVCSLVFMTGTASAVMVPLCVTVSVSTDFMTTRVNSFGPIVWARACA